MRCKITTNDGKHVIRIYQNSNFAQYSRIKKIFDKAAAAAEAAAAAAQQGHTAPHTHFRSPPSEAAASAPEEGSAHQELFQSRILRMITITYDLSRFNFMESGTFLLFHQDGSYTYVSINLQSHNCYTINTSGITTKHIDRARLISFIEQLRESKPNTEIQNVELTTNSPLIEQLVVLHHKRISGSLNDAGVAGFIDHYGIDFDTVYKTYNFLPVFGVCHSVMFTRLSSENKKDYITKVQQKNKDGFEGKMTELERMILSTKSELEQTIKSTTAQIEIYEKTQKTLQNCLSQTVTTEHTAGMIHDLFSGLEQLRLNGSGAAPFVDWDV